jgi:hypothetical protein
MTVRRGMAWGRPGSLPVDGIVVHDDAAARQTVLQHRRAGTACPALGLLGGDLARTCGGTGDAARLSEGGVVLPVDLGLAVVDGEPTVFVAHLVARRPRWSGPVVAIMNAQFLGSWDLAPRGHPNDGRLDVLTTAGLSVGDRWKARHRVRTGTHVPHPSIEEQRVTSWHWQGELLDLWLDGTRVGRCRSLEIGIEPDALTVVV